MKPEEFFLMINNPENLVEYLSDLNIIPNIEEENCNKCNGRVKLRIRNLNGNYSFLKRCVSCKNENSLLNGTFFSYQNENQGNKRKLPIRKTIELIYYYFQNDTYEEIMRKTGIKSKSTIVDWTNFIREKISLYLDSLPKLGGLDSIVQIDESLLRGRRKYGRGRLLLGDLIDSAPDHNSRRLNYGSRVDGPWVFGACEAGSRRIRMFYVLDRKRDTLFPILENFVDQESTIHSDQWAAYSTLGSKFRKHETVNHSESFIDPVTNAHTQKIESLWGHVKLRILKNMRGTTIDSLQSHLDFFCFIYENNSDPFEAFMRILKRGK